MKDNEAYGFKFDDYEDIASSTKRESQDFEDIISDTSMSGGGDNVSFTDISSGRYKKHKHGKATLGEKIADWWRKLTRGKKAALISVTSVLLVIAMLLVWFFTYFRYNYNDITDDPSDLGFTGVINEEVINIALFGLDTRNEKSFKGNSDSIMILSLNTSTKKVKIFSIMRDTFVPMDNGGKTKYGKINSAYAKGPEFAIKTLNQIFNLDISEYATVNFYGMTDIIDAVGGITATITEDELKWKGAEHPNLNNCMDEICAAMGLDPKKYYVKAAGEQQLNGVQAVAYSRVRYCTSVWGTSNDYGRTDRQRHVMEQLFNKALTLPKSQYTKLVKALTPCTETSLSYAEIISLAYNILLSGSPVFEQYRLPPAEHQSEFLMTSPSGYGSVIYYDLDYAAELIHGIIYDDLTMEQYIEQYGIKTNNWYKGGSGSYTGNSNNAQTTPSAPATSSEEDTSSEDSVSSSTPSDTDSSSDEALSEPSSSNDEASSGESSGDGTGDEGEGNVGSEGTGDGSSEDTGGSTDGDPAQGDGTGDENQNQNQNQTPTQNPTGGTQPQE